YRAAVSKESYNYFPPNFSPTIWTWIYETVARIYATRVSTLNGVLWTMHVELLGSIAVFAVFRFIPRRSIRIALNAIAATALFLLLSKDDNRQGLQLFC